MCVCVCVSVSGNSLLSWVFHNTTSLEGFMPRTVDSDVFSGFFFPPLILI